MKKSRLIDLTMWRPFLWLLIFGWVVEQPFNDARGQVHYTPYTFVTIAGAVQQYTNITIAPPPLGIPQEVTMVIPEHADGLGTNAHFYWPLDIAVSRGGIVYVADGANNVIRRITPLGQVTTIAGQPEVSGNADGSGTNATFFYPRGLALDALGNIYVADALNHCIRRLHRVGLHWKVTTIAGMRAGLRDGMGTNAQFFSPGGIVVDRDSIFVSDSQNDCIRQLTRVGSHWKVTTIAGSVQFTNIDGRTYRTSGYADGIGTNALFNFPAHITADGNGNLYVSDSNNHVIRRLRHRPDAWEVTTIAGSAGHPGHADAVGTNALFSNPIGIARDGAGDLYISDTGNFVVRKLTRTDHQWTAKTLAGMPGVPGSTDGSGPAVLFGRTNVWPGFSGGGAGIAVRRGSVYVTDTLNSTIRRGRPTPDR